VYTTGLRGNYRLTASEN